MTAHSAPASNPAADLAERWQAALADWVRWWTTAARGAASGSVAEQSAEAMATAMGLPRGEALAALNDKYRKRWEQLWGTAADALTHPLGTAHRMPAVAEAAPGDRRFAA
ncbi:MAG TPA: hypothetical protein VMU96_08940, partial [Casimicrobiaceae bacterium]|nr:hypothetical protein [Casimicrobiaceae bacterium]